MDPLELELSAIDVNMKTAMKFRPKKGGEFLGWMSNCQLLKEGCAPRSSG
jgi:hypothetical protein